jgi:PadR family transcriptional regulator, regulatory protein PadR
MLVLAALRDAPTHGYEVLNRLRDRSGGTLGVPEGSLYPALYRLEKAGYLRSRWEGNGRRRRVYELTPSGVEQLEGQRREWEQFWRGVQGVLEAG